MSKIVMVLGIALLAVGAALGVLGLIFPSRLIEHSLTMDTSAILVVGGILSWAIGNLTALIEKGAVLSAGRDRSEASYVTPSRPALAEASDSAETELPPLRPSFKGFGRSTTEVAAGVAAATAATAAAAQSAVTAAPAKIETMSPSVEETINALEQAKSDIRVALGVGNSPSPISSVATPPPPGTPEEDELEPFEATSAAPTAADDEAVPEDEPAELYVVEEKLIRGRPARVLSDGTVEAETEEGWMRFENLEHLNEYLDA